MKENPTFLDLMQMELTNIEENLVSAEDSSFEDKHSKDTVLGKIPNEIRRIWIYGKHLARQAAEDRIRLQFDMMSEAEQELLSAHIQELEVKAGFAVSFYSLCILDFFGAWEKSRGCKVETRKGWTAVLARSGRRLPPFMRLFVDNDDTDE